MLLGVLPFVDLAGGVVSFAHPTSIRHCCRAQNTITANSLQKNKQKRKKKNLNNLHLEQTHFNHCTTNNNS